MMRMVVDTNAFSDFSRGRPDRVDQFRIAIQILIPTIVIGELRAGFQRGSRAEVNEVLLQKFLASHRVHILGVDEETTHRYAAIYSNLCSRGALIPTNDIWIASLAIQHDSPLCTSDRHFQKVLQLHTI